MSRNPKNPLRRTLALLLAVLALFAAAGCSGGTGLLLPSSSLIVTATGRKVAQPGWTLRVDPDVQPTKKWTVLVFMNGANDLETYGVLNTNQMEQVGSTTDLNMVVQYKRIAGKFDSSNGDWSDTRRYYVTRDSDAANIRSTLISQNAAVDMGRPNTLQDFIKWGVETFPAERYCLVLWNHGAGWRKVNLPGATRGVSYDDVTGNHIDTIEMPAAIAHPDGVKWDALVIDCSLMQMVEVAYEIRNAAKFIVGSEESPPGEGYPYDTVMLKLAQSPAMTGRDLCVAFANDTLDRYGTGSNSTQSVLDASKVAPIAAKLDTLGRVLQAAESAHGTGISVARALAESYDYAENKDLLDFLDRLSENVSGLPRVPDPDVQIAVAGARAAILDAIVINRNGSQHPNSKGLAGLLTTPTRFLRIDTEQVNGFGQRYKFLALAKDAPGWLDFLANGPP